MLSSSQLSEQEHSIQAETNYRSSGCPVPLPLTGAQDTPKYGNYSISIANHALMNMVLDMSLFLGSKSVVSSRF